MHNGLRFPGVLLLFALCVLLGCDNAATPGGDGPAPGSADGLEQTVSLVIEFDDNTALWYYAVPWSPGMTVQALMDVAEDEAGPLSYRHTGRGETAILHAIDGFENQGAGQTANNWLYWVNDQFGSRGFGVAEIEPGDRVTWRFASYDASE